MKQRDVSLSSWSWLCTFWPGFSTARSLFWAITAQLKGSGGSTTSIGEKSLQNRATDWVCYGRRKDRVLLRCDRSCSRQQSIWWHKEMLTVGWEQEGYRPACIGWSPPPKKKEFPVRTHSWMLALGIGSTEDIFLFWCFSLHSNLSSRGVIFCNIPLERIMPGKFSQLKKKASRAFANPSSCCGLVPRQGEPGQASPREGASPQLGRHITRVSSLSRHYLRGGKMREGPQITAPPSCGLLCCQSLAPAVWSFGEMTCTEWFL